MYKLAIVTPASPVKREFVLGACEVLRERGIEPVIMPHALDKPDGMFASTLANRAEDFLSAWRNPSIGGILCARGGYGSIQLLETLEREISPDEAIAKPVIGFSDISILHAFLTSHGYLSIHGPMAKNISLGNESVDMLIKLLRHQGMPDYTLPPHPLNTEGKAIGKLVGGNLATFSGLADTQWYPLKYVKRKHMIMLIEDIGEPAYKIHRMLWQMHLQGRLEKLKGIIVGDFRPTEGETRDSIYYEIRSLLDSLNITYPVIFGFPAGHIDVNMPLVMGENIKIDVRSDGVRLRY